jgi:hypothetical protein
MDKKIEMEIGKIYFISFGGNTQIVGRYQNSDGMRYYFYDLLHYWNGSESFHHEEMSCYCVKSGIDEIRRASKAEKHALINKELEYDCI